MGSIEVESNYISIYYFDFDTIFSDPTSELKVDDMDDQEKTLR